jgi:hypothetical protein
MNQISKRRRMLWAIQEWVGGIALGASAAAVVFWLIWAVVHHSTWGALASGAVAGFAQDQIRYRGWHGELLFLIGLSPTARHPLQKLILIAGPPILYTAIFSYVLATALTEPEPGVWTQRVILLTRPWSFCLRDTTTSAVLAGYLNLFCVSAIASLSGRRIASTEILYRASSDSLS